MVSSDASKMRRLNILLTDRLLEWTSNAADRRGISVAALVREALEKEREREREEAIASAAESLAPLYSTDEELTAFLALDSEDFA